MNIFLRELRARLKSTVGWVIAMAVFMAASVTKFNTLSQDASASQALLSQFPATIQAVFGMSGLDVSTISGYYGVLFLYLLVIVAVHAGLLGANLLADEERDRTTEFLLVKPRSRRAVMTPKILAGVVYLIVLWLVIVLSSLAGIKAVSSLGNFMHDFTIFMAGLAAVQIAMFSIGLSLAGALEHPKSAGRIVAIIIFGSYAIITLIKLVPSLDWLRYISLFGYFDAAQILKDGAVPLVSWVVMSVLVVLGLVVAYRGYERRDIGV